MKQTQIMSTILLLEGGWTLQRCLVILKDKTCQKNVHMLGKKPRQLMQFLQQVFQEMTVAQGNLLKGIDNKTTMPCPSIGPKLFWTVQIVLVGSK